jgi:hypothetical protein
MNKKEANRVARQVGACFDAYFKNEFIINRGKHWKTRAPEDAEKVAHNSITANCTVGTSTDKKRGNFSWRIDVHAGEPRFVEPRFNVPMLDLELRKLLSRDGLMPVSQTANLRRGELYFSYRSQTTGQNYYFNFRMKEVVSS